MATVHQPGVLASTLPGELASAVSWRRAQQSVFDIFSRYDPNGDGFIDRSDLTGALRALGLASASIDSVLAQADADRDGYVSTDKLLQWVFQDGDDDRARCEALFQARVLQLVEHRADLNAYREDGLPLLTYAAEAGYEHAVRLLVQSGAEADTAGPKGYPHFGGTALTVSAYKGHEGVVQALIEGRASLDVQSGVSGKTAMVYAAERGHEAVLRALLEAGADASRTAGGQSPALKYLVKHRRLLASEPGPNEGAGASASRLLSAARCDDPQALRALLLARADVNARDEEGRTALILAAKGSTQDACVRALLELKANLHSRSTSGCTAAMWLAKRRRIAGLRLLAEAGADLVQKASETHRFYPGKNALQILEVEGCDPSALVPQLDWPTKAASVESLARVADSMKPNLLLASLSCALWDERDGVRNPSLAEQLADLLVLTLCQCREQRLTADEKAVQVLLLNAGTLRAVDESRRSVIKTFNCRVLAALQRSCDERQEQLQRTAAITRDQNVLFQHEDRHGALVADKPDQRDALPRVLWEWLEELPGGSFERLQRAFEAFEAIGVAPASPAFACFLINRGLTADHRIYARAAAHILVEYARTVDEHFKRFMTALFGSAFRHAPLKRIRRILAKLEADCPALADQAATAKNPKLRCLYFDLVDVVRGSVRAEGDDEMVNVVERLRSLASGTELGSFECWRVKNTHHAVAGEEVVGGYRDVKVIGRFRAPGETPGGLPVSMIVEVQVVDAVFLAIKKYMHKPYSIERGDFG